MWVQRRVYELLSTQFKVPEVPDSWEKLFDNQKWIPFLFGSESLGNWAFWHLKVAENWCSMDPIISHQYTPVMLAFFYQHHGCYGFGFFGFCTCKSSCKSSIIKDSDDSEHHQGKCWSQMLPSVWAPDAWTNGFHLTVWTTMDHRAV